jgi:hypothetical protein
VLSSAAVKKETTMLAIAHTGRAVVARASGSGLAKIIGSLAIGICLQVTPAAASDIVGTWSGSGTVTLASGAREKARCRATFIAAGGKTYAMSATCATSSAKVSQTAIVSQNTKNRYGGTFYNPEFGVTGRIRIIVSGPRQTVYLSGSSGRATFTMRRR